MQLNNRKIFKIATLLLTSAIIASVSAVTYSYMYIQGSGSITTGGLSWETGTDAPAGTTISGVYVQNMNFSIPADSPRNFTDSLHLINADNSNHNFGIGATVTSGTPSKFNTFDLVIYNSTDIGIAKVSVKDGASQSGLTISALETLYVRFEVNPVIGETSGGIAFTVTLTYEV